METKSNQFAPETCHEHLLRTLEPALSYSSTRNYEQWRELLGARLRELVGPTPAVVPLNVECEPIIESDGCRETRFQFTSETGADVPCHDPCPGEPSISFSV